MCLNLVKKIYNANTHIYSYVCIYIYLFIYLYRSLTMALTMAQLKKSFPKKKFERFESLNFCNT